MRAWLTCSWKFPQRDAKRWNDENHPEFGLSVNPRRPPDFAPPKPPSDSVRSKVVGWQKNETVGCKAQMPSRWSAWRCLAVLGIADLMQRPKACLRPWRQIVMVCTLQSKSRPKSTEVLCGYGFVGIIARENRTQCLVREEVIRGDK